MIDSPALIGVDWGTTNARGFLLGASGAVIETRHAEIGIRRIEDGDYAGTFTRTFGDWLTTSPGIPVLLCGMIGSRSGWSEAPYLSCPVDVAQLAQGLHPIPPTACQIIPGVSLAHSSGRVDVMRGEETQLAGLALQDTPLVCLPGTHSKWVHVEEGVIVDFETCVTGELYDLLSRHSILIQTTTSSPPAASAPADNPDDTEAFLRGVAQSRRESGLLSDLFQVRALSLFGRLWPGEQRPFLSGLLIGHEVHNMLAARSSSGPVTLVGAAGLTEAYARALHHFGVESKTISGEQAAATGLWRIAQAAGLTSVL